jgi:hypothetical protein
MTWPRLVGSILAAWFLTGPATAQTYLDTIGYTDLQTRLGAATPNGAGVWVAQVEADASTSYTPDPAVGSGRPGFAITLKSGTSVNDSHATGVAFLFYGNGSMASGVTRVDSWYSNDWLTSGFLGFGSTLPPTSNIPKVSNHSYVGSAGGSNDAYLLRVDYLADRGGQVVVAAAGGSANGLIGTGYNSIAVGTSTGGTGGFTPDGRVKPDLVAPMTTLSQATPIVSAAATLLVQAAGSDPLAAKPQTIKAALLAGATKTGLAGPWSHTQTQPLDSQFGAGMVNVNNSHLILTAGRQPASTASPVAATGWDFNTVSSATAARTYLFDVPAGGNRTISAALTWHRVVNTSMVGTVANLDLKLYSVDANNNLVGSPVDQSVSAVDNVEHIWLPSGLPAGRYAWHVELTSGGTTDYALAWQTYSFVPVPEPGAVIAAATVVLAVGRRVRRRAAESVRVAG